MRLLSLESEIGSVRCSVRSDSTNPQTLACQAPLSMGFPRQEYWVGLPFPSPGDLPNSRIKPWSPTLLVDFLPSKLPRKAGIYNNKLKLDYIFLYTNGIIKCNF